MLKTNSKQARENMRRHVIECAGLFLEEREDIDPEKLITSAWEIISREVSGYSKNPREAFRHHVRGLGFGYFMDARDILRDVLEETEEEAARYSNTEAEELYTYLLECRFFELLDKEARR